MSDDSTTPVLPPLLSADDLYETLMGSIEPELTLENLPAVILALKNDTPDQQKGRFDRYNRAFAEYDRRLAEHKKAWDTAFAAFNRDSFASLKKFFTQADEKQMLSIEKELDA